MSFWSIGRLLHPPYCARKQTPTGSTEVASFLAQFGGIINPLSSAVFCLSQKYIKMINATCELFYIAYA